MSSLTHATFLNCNIDIAVVLLRLLILELRPTSDSTAALLLQVSRIAGMTITDYKVSG